MMAIQLSESACELAMLLCRGTGACLQIDLYRKLDLRRKRRAHGSVSPYDGLAEPNLFRMAFDALPLRGAVWLSSSSHSPAAA